MNRSSFFLFFERDIYTDSYVISDFIEQNIPYTMYTLREKSGDFIL